jgi:RNA polymerase sigma factor (sigma-70 family)
MTSTINGKRVRIGNDPLRMADRIDEPLPGNEEGEATRMDFVPDPASEEEYQAVEDAEFNRELHNALEEVLRKLSERERKIIRKRYLEPTMATLATTDMELGITKKRMRQIENKGLRTLQRDQQLQQFHEEVIQSHAYSGTGLQA